MSRPTRIIIAYGEATPDDAARSIHPDSDAVNIIVNNGPTSWAGLPRDPRLDRHQIIEFLDNPGYLPAVIRTLETVDLGESEWIIISNADITTLQDATEFAPGPDVAVVGPAFSPSSRHWNPREPSIRRQTALVSSGLIRYLMALAMPWVNLPRRTPSPSQRTAEPIMVYGACFAIRTSVLRDFSQTVKLPRLYGEEVLIAWFLTDTGRRFTVDPNWLVEHLSRGTAMTAGVRRAVERERLRSRLRILRLAVARQADARPSNATAVATTVSA